MCNYPMSTQHKFLKTFISKTHKRNLGSFNYPFVLKMNFFMGLKNEDHWN